MALDISWLLERQLDDDSWIAVSSNDQAIESLLAAGLTYQQFWDEPPAQACRRDYGFFSLLSPVMDDYPTPQDFLAHVDIPVDASETAREWCLYDHRFDPCYADLATIEGWSSETAGPDYEPPEDRIGFGDEISRQHLIDTYKTALLRVAEDQRLITRVLRLPLRDEDGALSYGEHMMSAHQQIEDGAMLKRLKPLAPTTARFYFVFDN